MSRVLHRSLTDSDPMLIKFCCLCSGDVLEQLFGENERESPSDVYTNDLFLPYIPFQGKHLVFLQ